MQPPTLAVIAGPHAGNTVAVTDHPVTVGRSSRCALVLADADTSRRHAVVQARGGQLFVHDLGSTNGTRIDGTPVGVVPVPLTVGARLAVGGSVLTADLPTRRGDDPVALLRAAATGAAEPVRSPLRVRVGHRNGVPVHHDLGDTSLAVTGPYSGGVARWLLAQLVAVNPANRLRVAVLAVSASRWRWAVELPHRTTLDGLAPRSTTVVVADVRDGGLVDPSLGALLRAGPASGVLPLVVARTAEETAALCDATVEPADDSGTRLRIGDAGPFTLDAVTERWAARLAGAVARQPAVASR